MILMALMIWKVDTSLTLATLKTIETLETLWIVETDHSAGEAPAHYGGHIARSLELEPGRGEREADWSHPRVDLRCAREPDEADIIVDCLRLPGVS